MKRELEEALNNVEMTYSELNEIAQDMTKSYFDDINAFVKTIDTNKSFLNSIDSIREAMLKLSLYAFSLSEIKDKASLKQECAETIKKEKYASSFNLSDGSIANRENSALLNASNEIVINVVYDVVASLFKTKVDELHRLVDALKTIMMSRMQENKMSQNISVGEASDKTVLME